MLLLQSCGLLIIPIEHAYESLEYKKDVSSDPKRGYIVGKKFELIQDLYLNQFKGEGGFSLNKQLVQTVRQEKDGSWICEVDPTNYSVLKIIPKGTILIVSKVLVKAIHLGGELCSQKIKGEFIDQEGNLINADISSLFKKTWFHPDEDWIFTPKPDLLLEIKS